jgi:SAM-dependent methyltransferase
VLREDITALTFDNDQFDVIICSHVLEHVPNDVRAIAEIFRVLKDDGCAILQVPLEATRAKTHEDLSIIDPAGREKAFGHPEHVRVYGMDFLERLQSVGFSVSVNRAIDLFTPEQVKKHGLDEEEAIYACTK